MYKFTEEQACAIDAILEVVGTNPHKLSDKHMEELVRLLKPLPVKTDVSKLSRRETLTFIDTVAVNYL